MPFSLSDARARANLTQAALGALAGISRISVAKLESGRVLPQPATVYRIAQALGLEPKDLRFGVPPSRAQRNRSDAAEGLHRIADSLEDLVQLLRSRQDIV